MVKLVQDLSKNNVNLAMRVNYDNLAKRIEGVEKDVSAMPNPVTSVNGKGPGAVTIRHSDINGTVSLTNGGTGSDLSAAGPGVLQMNALGSNVAVTALGAEDLYDGVTGTGAVVRANGPNLTNPVITGLSVADANLTGTPTISRATFNVAGPDLANGITFPVYAYLRAYATAAGQSFGTWVPYPTPLHGAGSYTFTTVVSNLTNCSVARSGANDNGFVLTLTSTAAGDCVADMVYTVRGN